MVIQAGSKEEFALQVNQSQMEKHEGRYYHRHLNCVSSHAESDVYLNLKARSVRKGFILRNKFLLHSH